MNLENFLTAFQIRKLYRNTSVKTSGTKQSRIKGIRAVGCSQDYNTLGAVKAIHFGKQLVQGLLTLIISACEASAVTLLTDGIDLVNEYDTGSLLIGLLKQVTNLGSTHTNKHFHKFRTGDGEERDLCFSCNCLGKQGLTGTWRAYKKGTFWHGCCQGS